MVNTLFEQIRSKITKLYISYHGVWRSQNKAGVKASWFNVTNIKKVKVFLFYIINFKRNLKQFIWLIAIIYQYKVDIIILLECTWCMQDVHVQFS